MLYACRHILYIELRGVYEPGTEGIFHSLMGGVDRQLAEDVLAVRVHGVDGAYAVLRYLLRGASARNGLEHVNLCRREQLCAGMALPLLNEHLRGTLAHIAVAARGIGKGIGNDAQRSVFEHHAHAVGTVGDGAHELIGEPHHS